MQAKPTFFKTTGKVLIAGGYAVLEEGNVGLSLALNRHFYSITKSDGQSSQGATLVNVKSPQIHQQWSYLFEHESNTIHAQTGQQNHFVQNAIKFALLYANHSNANLPKSISIMLLFDRGFLSQTETQVASHQKFLEYEPGASKTGLGSSACVVVAVVGGILRQCLRASEAEINAVSHTANIAAQNKIGSNFDISTALFGSQFYTNRLPRLALEAVSSPAKLIQISKIDPMIKQVKPNTAIRNSHSLLIDLKKGSNTRTMVTGFIKNLNLQQQELVRQFYVRSKSIVGSIFEIMTADMDRKEAIQKLKEVNSSYRELLQYYSGLTKVGVEPSEFKQFLDELSRIQDIGYCICPGSGGYDAIFVLCLAEDVAGWSAAKSNVGICCGLFCNLFEISEVCIQWQREGMLQKEERELMDYVLKCKETI